MFWRALLPQVYYRSDARMSAVMIEMNRRLYLDESTGQSLAGFDVCRHRLATMIAGLIKAAA